ncbi:MAG TPA: GTPase ObgE [Candidatus Saccharimonadales bacterium]|nr:GTPase ObgE [Candidatus Saccharimonadales bacterium]
MNFIDKTKVIVRAGSGGDGKLSFRQEKFIAKGGPDGGDGGHGGNVVFAASRNQNTLAAFRYQRELQAEPGQPGGKKRMHGRSGKDLMVPVPVGTVVTDLDGNELADLVEDGQTAVIAKGGKGGFGNAHFVSSRRQAPKFAEKGEAGQELEALLELKMIADVGLVGLPNAGKSTLLSRISNARPEIANYPFTTLTPNLGVVDIDKESSLLFADIPGLIEGAAEGKGLGHEFLRHIERTAVIIHLIDAYQPDIAAAYTTIQEELKAYEVNGQNLAERPQIVVLNKVDGLDADMVEDIMAQLKKVIPENTPIHPISAASGVGIRELLYAVRAIVNERRKVVAEQEAEDEIPVLRMDDTTAAWSIESADGSFIVRGPKIEQFAARTDFKNEEAVQRLRDIMKKMGILHELVRKGIEPGQIIRIADRGELTY